MGRNVARKADAPEAAPAVRAPMSGGTVGVPVPNQQGAAASSMPTVQDGPRVARALMGHRPFKQAPRYEVLPNPSTAYDADLRGGHRVVINHAIMVMRPGRIIQGGFDVEELKRQGVKLKELDPPEPPPEEAKEPEEPTEDASA